jgi:cytochrome c oxidase subunit 1
MSALIRAIAWGVVGSVLGAAAVVIVRAATGQDLLDFGQVTLAAYPLGLAGWLLGIGVWDQWAREWFGLPLRHVPPHGWRRYFAFTQDHKVIGIQYLVTFTVLLLLAGLFAMLIRIQLLRPSGALLDMNQYNTVMGWHGIVMIAVAVAMVMGGFANFVVPLLIGARDVAFPRVNALSYWLVPPVAVLLLLAFLAGGWDSGWTAYPPLATVNADGQLLFNLAIVTFGLSSILGGLNFIVTIATLRAPGMTWGRVPIFVWSVLAASLLSFTVTQFLAAAMIMEILDRVAGASFFNAAQGGAPLLYQHVFWFYSHPAVYIMVLPGMGIVLEILSHFSRKPLFAYRVAVAGFLGIVALSGIVWAHHLFVAGIGDEMLLPFMITTELISIPTGLVFLSALGTIWLGKLWLRTPMLFALGFVFNFLIGGLTGITLADVPTDMDLNNTYWVVAHFHYTIMGGEVFAIMAALYYWFPKITGRMFNETLGKIHFWWMFLAFNATFLLMFWVGLNGMNRRIASYPPELTGANQVVSAFSFALGASFLVFIVNLVWSWARGPRAAADPWHARTLEWQVPSPPPEENFPRAPEVIGHPYDYGVTGAAHAAFAAPAEGGGTR